MLRALAIIALLASGPSNLRIEVPPGYIGAIVDCVNQRVQFRWDQAYNDGLETVFWRVYYVDPGNDFIGFRQSDAGAWEIPVAGLSSVREIRYGVSFGQAGVKHSQVYPMDEC